MAVVNLSYPRFKAFADGTNLPLDGGKVYVYAAGTTDPVDTYTDINIGTANANPVILDSNGEADIWFNSTVKLILTDSDDVQLWSLDNVQANIEPTVTGNQNLVQNGSFEVDTNSDSEPDNWTLAASTDGTIAIDATSGGYSHGSNGLKFTSGGSGGGAATTTPYIEVLASTDIQVIFSLKSSSATVKNIVTVLWYQNDSGTASSTPSTAVYSDTATNPTSWTIKSYSATAPADATYCKLKIEGVEASGTTVTSGASTHFDDIRIYQGPMLFPNITTAVLFNDTEAAILDGATVTTDELNKLDGYTGTAAELDLLASQVGGFLLKGIVSAGGTADAITGDFTPNISLTDKTTVIVRAAYANATTTPTFAPDGLTAYTIVKNGGQALAIGDIRAADHNIILQYNSTNTQWELLNPYKPKFRGCLAISDGPTISHDTPTAVSFTTEHYDTDSIHDPSTNNTRMTVPADVTKVRIQCTIIWDNYSATGVRTVNMQKNGTALTFGYTATETSGVPVLEEYNNLSTPIITVTSGDYFEVIAYQNSTASQDITGTVSWFSMEIIE